MRRRFAILGLMFASVASACETFVVLGGVDDASIDDADSADARSDALLSNDVSSDVQEDTTFDAGFGGCFTNADCLPANDYCKVNLGAACGSLGSCEARPTSCTDGSIYDANFEGSTVFCDCAGDTVPNPCSASFAGENIRHTGPCP